MNSLRPNAAHRTFLRTALVALLCASFGVAAPDDFDEQPTPQPGHEVQFNMVNINVDQQIFQNHSSEHSARDEIKESLQLQIEAIDLICHLEERQKAKLMLSAQGDMSRFFNAVSELRQEFTQAKNDGNVWNTFWQRVQPLQMRYTQGMFQENSLFEKALRTTLNDEQLRLYNTYMQDRKNQFLRTRCELAVMEFEKSLPIRSGQRKRLLELLDKERERFSDQAEFPQVHWILQLPEEKLRPIFEDWQWKKLEPHIRQFNPRPIINNRNFLVLPMVR